MRITLTIAFTLLVSLFATPAASAAAPILVVKSSAHPYSGYVEEILRAEGLNGFQSVDVNGVTPELLAGYDVVVLGDVPVTAGQASTLSGWVSAGGNLVALSPDPALAGLLGLAPTGGALDDAYLAVDTTRPPGAGIVAETIQYHGRADAYALQGATAVATLYTDAATPASSPAVTLRSVGGNGGEAAAFTFDVARSVSLTRQGNPAWTGTDRDGDAPIRTNDLFFGGDEPHWVDLAKIDIPQADELQRLLANVITYVSRDRAPVPRFWYLPHGEAAAVVMTGDDHNEGGTEGRFEQYKAASPPGCSVVLWECVRSTSYIYAEPHLEPLLTAAEANAYVAQGFEVAMHPTRGGCTNPDADVFNAAYAHLQVFASRYPGVPAPATSRFHCVSWPDWSTHAKVSVAHGIRLDTNYYHYPPAWGDIGGYMTGSAEIMRFADADGSTIPLYQAHTHLNDETMNPAQVGVAINRFLDAATGPDGFYGLVTANMHTDQVTSAGSDAIVASAKARSVPVVSARQALEWTEGRDGSSFADVTWSGGRLGFTVNAGPNTTGLQGMVPLNGATGRLQSVSRGGIVVPVTARTIKGVEYGFFAAVPGRYEAQYEVQGASAAVGDRRAPSLRLSAPRRQSLRKVVRRGVAFRVSCSEPCRLTARLTARIGRRTVVLGRKARNLQANRRVRIVVKVTRRGARRLRRAHPARIRLHITARDASRNTRTVVRRIRLLKPR